MLVFLSWNDCVYETETDRTIEASVKSKNMNRTLTYERNETETHERLKQIGNMNRTNEQNVNHETETPNDDGDLIETISKPLVAQWANGGVLGGS